MSIDLHKLEKQFYSDGFRLGLQASDKNHLISSVHKMYDLIDEFIDYFIKFAETNKHHTDCKKGCSWCCYQPIFILSYEMDALNDFINKEFDKQTRLEIQNGAASKQNKLESMHGDKLLNSKFPCPLLKDGYCLVYLARPMACRIYLSSSLETCLKFFNYPDDEKSFPALHQFPMRAGRLMNEGFKSSLKNNGIITNEFRIEEGILKHFSTY